MGIAWTAAPPPPPPTVELWPENAVPVALFRSMGTQWRFGSEGVIGLDYGVLPLVERRLGVRRRVARDAFAALRVLEDEALNCFDELRARSVQ